jgi:hypothetical protein
VNIRCRSQWEIRTPARNIVGICSGSHEKKVNLGEVFGKSERETERDVGMKEVARFHAEGIC